MLKRIIATTLVGCMMLVTLTSCGPTTKPASNISSTTGSATSGEQVSDTAVSSSTTSNVPGTSSGTAPGTTSGGQTVSKPGVGTNSTGKPGQNASTTSGTGDKGAKYFKVWWGNEDESMAAAISDYQKAHTDVTIRPVSADSTVAKLKTAISAGEEPNIVMMDHVYITALGRSKQILDLNKFGANSIKDKYISSCWEGVSFGGSVYGLPHNGNTIALMYNKTMLDAANQRVPKTFDQMRSVGKSVKKYIGNDLKKGEFAFTSPFFDVGGQGRLNWSAFVYFFWLWRNGGDILNSANTKATFNSAAGISALTQLQTLVKDGVCADNKYMETNFYNGTVGMIEMGNWSIPQLTSTARNAEFGVSMLPTLKTGVPQYSGLGLFALGITSKTKNPEVAYDFLKYYTTNVGYQMQYGKQHNQLPVLKAALGDSFYSKGFWPVYIQQYAKSKSRPGVTNWDKIEALIANSVNKAIGGANAKDTLNKAANQVNAYL